MKRILTFISMAIYALAIDAQSFVFEKDGVELPDNAEYEVSEIDRVGVMESGLELVNKTNTTIGIVVSQTVLVAPSSANAFLNICYDVCRTTNENTSESGNLGVGSNNFHVYFVPESGHDDRAVVKYEAVHSSNPSEKIAATVTYKYGNGTAIETIESGYALKISQNGDQIIFNTQSINKKDLRISVYNVAGQLKATQMLPDRGEAALTVRLERGIYIVSLNDGKETIETRKFIIR
ncbi:MAG: T9SS type A sorting domain-containing protein [Dysgonamonadaceae bacterium]|jgi:hypothetical protein|nr:T9SS type A sorting domain-containing protein [Dysgonamonadaceae bacterium]